MAFDDLHNTLSLAEVVLFGGCESVVARHIAELINVMGLSEEEGSASLRVDQCCHVQTIFRRTHPTNKHSALKDIPVVGEIFYRRKLFGLYPYPFSAIGLSEQPLTWIFSDKSEW
jgi:hypothetical protein